MELSTQAFLPALITGMSTSPLLREAERAVLLPRASAASAGEPGEIARVVDDYWFVLARDFVRRIPGPVTIRMFGAERWAQKITSPELEGGLPLPEIEIPTEEAILEVRCRWRQFDSGSGLPTSANFQIALREIEYGFKEGERLVYFGGFGDGCGWATGEDRLLAFRLASPSRIVRQMREDYGEAALTPVYTPGVVTCRDYETALVRRQWPAGVPTIYLPVDEEGAQHPLYFLYHDLGHGAIRFGRMLAIQETGLALLSAGLATFPDIDDLAVSSPFLTMIRRLMSQMIELKRVYYASHFADRLCTTFDEIKTLAPPAERARYQAFLQDAGRRVAALQLADCQWDFTPLISELRREETVLVKAT